MDASKRPLRHCHLGRRRSPWSCESNRALGCKWSALILTPSSFFPGPRTCTGRLPGDEHGGRWLALADNDPLVDQRGLLPLAVLLAPRVSARISIGESKLLQLIQPILSGLSLRRSSSARPSGSASSRATRTSGPKARSTRRTSRCRLSFRRPSFSLSEVSQRASWAHVLDSELSDAYLPVRSSL